MKVSYRRFSLNFSAYKEFIMIKSILEDYSKYIKDEKKLSKNTWKAYIRDITCFNKYLRENSYTSLLEVNKTVIIRYLIHLQKKGKTASSISRNLSGIRCLFQFLLGNNYIKEDPTLNLKAPKGERKLPLILTVEEINLLLSLPDDSTIKGARDKAMLELIYSTGMKFSELNSLNLEDLDFEMKSVNIKSKNNVRRAPVNEITLFHIKKYLKICREGSNGKDPLFINCNGNRLTRQGLWKVLKSYAKESKINKNITPQVLRNSFAVHLLNNGADVKSLQEMLGHSDINTTNIYCNNSNKRNIKEVYNDSYVR